jgi:hypothetical protein
MTTQVIRTSALATVVMLGLVPAPAQMVSAAPNEAFPHIVSGTLMKLDLNTFQGVLQTDLEKPVFFEVPKAYLFENITVGARIILQLDPDGQAVRVMDTSLPDLIIAPAIMPAANMDATPSLAPSLHVPDPHEQGQ